MVLDALINKDKALAKELMDKISEYKLGEFDLIAPAIGWEGEIYTDGYLNNVLKYAYIDLKTLAVFGNTCTSIDWSKLKD